MFKKQFYHTNIKLKIPFLIISLCLIHISSSSCSLGCLKCSQKSKECLFCDFKSFYYKDNPTQTCKRNPLKNCLISFTPTQCLICKENYYPNKNGKCNSSSKHPNPIKNCLNYYSVSGCAKCNQNYYLSKNGKSCLQSKLQNKSDCVVFGKNSCLICVKNFVYNAQRQICESKFIILLIEKKSRFWSRIVCQRIRNWDVLFQNVRIRICRILISISCLMKVMMSLIIAF